MINRYSRSEMSQIWSDESKFKHWLKVECAVLKVLEQKKVIPVKISDLILKKAKINIKRIGVIESKVKHDVIAFCTSIAEQFDKKGRYFHYGLTSSDVVDTAFSLLIIESLKIIKKDLFEFKITLKKQALKYKSLYCIARTHGIHAEPSVFGLKFLSWYAEINRKINDLKYVENKIKYGKISGAVGVYGLLGPEIEKLALKRIGLNPEFVSTQILPRDRHLDVMQLLSNIANSIERISLEIRHLQRTEVAEVEESFSKGQKGSSAMPHKKNPIASENLSGCARVMRGYVAAVSENTALWHERDISHSSVERICFPDAFILLDYMIARVNSVINNIVVKKENVTKNLNLLHGVTISGTILNALVEKGMQRESAYKIIQQYSLKSIESKRSLKDYLKSDKIINEYFTQDEIDLFFNLKNRFKNIDKIYKRVN